MLCVTQGFWLVRKSNTLHARLLGSPDCFKIPIGPIGPIECLCDSCAIVARLLRNPDWVHVFFSHGMIAATFRLARLRCPIADSRFGARLFKVALDDWRAPDRAHEVLHLTLTGHTTFKARSVVLWADAKDQR